MRWSLLLLVAVLQAGDGGSLPLAQPMQLIRPQVTQPIALPRITKIGWHPQRPGRLYGRIGFGSVIASDDGGATFRLVHAATGNFSGSLGSSPLVHIAGDLMFLDLAVNNELGLLSRDGGDTFARLACPAAPAGVRSPQPDQRFLLSDERLVVIHRPDAKPQALVSLDVGTTWTALDLGPEPYAVVPASTTLAVRGRKESQLHLLGATSGAAIDLRHYSPRWRRQDDLLVVWATTGNGWAVCNLKTGTWQTFRIAEPFTGQPAAIACDPRQPGTLYAAIKPYGLVRTHDGGATWERLPDLGEVADVDLQGRERPVLAAAIGEQVLILDLDRLPAGTFVPLRSAAADDVATRLRPPLSRVVGTRAHTGDPKHLLAWSDQTLVRSRDGGQTWTTLIDKLPAGHAIIDVTWHGTAVFAQFARGSRFAGTRSDDDGITFTPVPLSDQPQAP